jgi:hypothetical protein
MTFKTKKELIKWLKENGYAQLRGGEWYRTGSHYLAHGEYSQPEFSTRCYKDGWSLRGYYHFYADTFFSTKNGRVPENFYA